MFFDDRMWQVCDICLMVFDMGFKKRGPLKWKYLNMTIVEKSAAIKTSFKISESKYFFRSRIHKYMLSIEDRGFLLDQIHCHCIGLTSF